MKIVLLDNNKDRLKEQSSFWRERYPSIEFHPLATISSNYLRDLSCDIMVIHANNCEFSLIVHLGKCKYKRVYFSGGFRVITQYIEDDEYYVPFTKLNEFIENLIEHE